MKGISAIQKAGCTSWNVSSLPFAVYSLCLIIRSGFENALVFRLSTFTVYHTIPAFSCHKFVTNLPKTATEKKVIHNFQSKTPRMSVQVPLPVQTSCQPVFPIFYWHASGKIQYCSLRILPYSPKTDHQ